ncbi:hypothetical protein [Collimonas pratensis]|uniref:hypothetical protein n=1 Tax=Collimonas pratensis TaxID=279113 RepID=UPI000783534F|nr:hypothetical protein [Collimonas pratensis]
MKTFNFNDVWQFIRSQNSHLRMTDLAVGSILGMLMGTTLAVLVAFRLSRETWSPDLILLGGLCGAGLVAFFIYGALAFDRGRGFSARRTDRRSDIA